MEAAKIDSAAPQSSSSAAVSAAVSAAMQAARNISINAPKAPRVSRFSSTLLTKKLYYPQENLDIDYTMIFNGPYRSTIETETHTTLSLGGTATIVTSMDEPLYVMISASNKEDLEAAEAMVSAVFTKLDHARRLMADLRQQSRPEMTSMVKAIGTVMEDVDGASSVKEVVKVPIPTIPVLMGYRGEHIKKIEDIYGVRIHVQRDSECNPGVVLREVTVVGLEDNVKKAVEVINNVVKTGSADVIRSIQTSRDGFEMIFIPRERVGLVVGTRGATIQEVQRRTSTSVQVSKEADPDHPDMRSIVITGSKENVKEAKRQILKIADGLMATFDVDGPSTRIHIPADKVCWVIGQRGATIKDIQRKTGTILQVDTDDDDRHSSLRTIVIAGTEEQQQAAIAEINRVIGTTAGTREFREDEFAKQNGGYMPTMTPMTSMFSSSIDLETMQKFMEKQMMSNAYMYGMQPQAGTAGAPEGAPVPPMPPMQPMQSMQGMPPMQGIPPMQPMPPMQGMQGMQNMQGGAPHMEAKETVPGMEDEALPPGVE